MLQSSLHIFSYPHQNGVTLFFIGALFLLSIYHLILFIQNKDKSFLFYSFYTGFIFLRSLHEPQNCFLNQLDSIEPLLNTTGYFSTNLEWAYNTIYFVFAFTFIDLKSYSKKWYRFIFGAVAFLLFLNVFIEIIYLTTTIKNIYSVFRWVFIVLLLLLSIIGYIPLFKIKGVLKYYIIVGSLSFLFFSILALIVSKYGLISKGTHINVSIFYVGAIIENLCFSLGLGHRQKLILQQKYESQQKLIDKYEENEYLQLEIKKQLELDMVAVSKKIKQEKLELLKEKYDKELVKLKLTLLQSQMNPHFIFNSLNAIKLYIINNEKENAVYYLNKFSKLIRKILDATRKKETTLAEEIDTIELYLNIENIRFNNEIDFKIIIDKKTDLTIKMPPLILQPFVENALWHGLANKKNNKKLTIQIKKDTVNCLLIKIKDNGIGRTKSLAIKKQKIHRKKSFGIALTKERLSNFFKGYHYSLTIVDLYDGKNAIGTEVILKLPTNRHKTK